MLKHQIIFLSIFLFSNSVFSGEKILKWKGLNLKLTETVKDSLLAGGSCKVIVSKGKKVLSEYEFNRSSAVGGGADICSYSIPSNDSEFWFVRFNGDYNFPYIAIDENGKKYEFQYMPELYKIDKAQFLFGVHSSEVDGVAEISFFDIKKNGQFHIFGSETLKKHFTPMTYRHEVLQMGEHIFFKVVKNNKIFRINIGSKKIQLVDTVPVGASKASVYLPGFHKIN